MSMLTNCPATFHILALSLPLCSNLLKMDAKSEGLLEEKFERLMDEENKGAREVEGEDSVERESGGSVHEIPKKYVQKDARNSAESSLAQSRSTTPDSTSTYEYSHEPFLTYQHKIIELASQIGATTTTSVTRLMGGSSNRVISATICCCCEDESATQVKGVFRIPRFTVWEDDEKAIVEPYELDRRVHEQAVLSCFLAVHEIPAPRILAFDATGVNAIHSPYTFQEFAEGRRLDEAYDDMSLEEKLNIVDEYVSMLVRLESIRFEKAGRIGCVEQAAVAHIGLPNKLGLFEQRSSSNAAAEVKIMGFGTGGEPRVPTRTARFPLQMLNEQLDSWIKYEVETARGPSAVTAGNFKQLKSAVREMETLGFFEPLPPSRQDLEESNNVLFYCDLEPRNILVVSSSEDLQSRGGQKWRISSVLDWDDALALPSILTRKPPIWLWDISELDAGINKSIPADYDGDVDLVPTDRYAESGGRLSEDERRIKRHFEESLVRQLSIQNPSMNMAVYQDETYGRGRWLRRLTRFALDGFGSNLDFDRFDRFVEEWASYHATLQISSN
jgi:hypothetical protein